MVRKRDRFWEYVELLDGKFKCKFCYRKFAGGVPRVKSHLSGLKGCGIDICTKVPKDVRVAAAEAVSGLNKRAKAEACSGGEEKEKFVQEMMLYRNRAPKLFTSMAVTMLGTCHPCDWWDYCGGVLPVLKKYAIRILSQPCSTSLCRQSLSAFEIAQTEKRKPLMPAVMDDYLYLRTNALLMENFNTMKEKIMKPLDLVKLGELPDFTEFINENLTRDLLNEIKVPSSDEKLNSWRKDDKSEKHFRLHFITKIPSSLVKGDEVKGEREPSIHVILVDSSTGRVVQSGPLSVLKLMVTVIGGDFDEEAGENWTIEFFESNEMRGQEGKIPLLTGDLSVILNKGMGTLGSITFNDESSWTRSGKFRLGVKTALDCCEGIRVLEGTSNAFFVQAPLVLTPLLSLSPYANLGTPLPW